jgi:hypothetical protein
MNVDAQIAPYQLGCGLQIGPISYRVLLCRQYLHSVAMLVRVSHPLPLADTNA